MSDFERERLTHKGRLLEREQEIRRMESELDGLRSLIRQEMDLFRPLHAISGEMVSNFAIKFAQVQIEYGRACREAEAIRRALGE